MFKNILASSLLICLTSVSFVYAQDMNASQEIELLNPYNGSSDDQQQPQRPRISLEQFPSLFLTPNEQSLLREARAGFNTADPNKIDNSMGSVLGGSRELILGGVAYRSRAEWAIWLNGQKITPKNLPPEILDINVYKDYIRLKWVDSATNQIFPVKLRANQRFNMDTRMFLPGAGM